MRGLVVVVLATLMMVPGPAVAGGAVTHTGGGLGKSYFLRDCYTPATMEVVIDEGGGVVRAKTVNPCGYLPLGAVLFEHTFALDQCTLARSLRCEGTFDGARVVVLSDLVGDPALDMVYFVTRGGSRFIETFATATALS
jgi:hypothetical protein